MTYRIELFEYSWGCVDVEAESLEEAKEIALDEYEAGNAYWDGGDCITYCKEYGEKLVGDKPRVEVVPQKNKREHNDVTL